MNDCCLVEVAVSDIRVKELLIIVLVMVEVIREVFDIIMELLREGAVSIAILLV